MKNSLILLALLMLTSVYAQDNCSKFYATREGQKLTIHQYDKRERLEIIAKYKVKEIENSGDQNIITIDMDLTDGRNNDHIISSSFKARCSGNTTRLDPESFIAPGILGQYDGMQYSITGDDISIPNDLDINQELPNASVHMSVNGGIMNINTTIAMSDRKVIAKEEITTPAGTFDCYVITYTNTVTMGIRKTFQSTQWISEGVGMVKEETRKPNGRLVTRSILHQIN
ncbi:TapB family protein [Aquimarina algicola]|uniref:DUF3108 domain-containing protein n=1 Tax=Aquimarina algicola TaxID=2589995 RepID=A0A504JFU4_9FLAO|nr:hypothetical protein [Aquimarina algicola]TPN85380.1 hypothetical protein FHK87_15300 [Aquimarina algicola]